jgi:uncharacterized protein YjbJ (UPF0337 family)
MNMEELKGKWKQVKGKAKEQWSELTEDDLNAMDGRRDQMIGKLKERYGKSLEEARKEVDAFLDNL